MIERLLKKANEIAYKAVLRFSNDKYKHYSFIGHHSVYAKYPDIDGNAIKAKVIKTVKNPSSSFKSLCIASGMISAYCEIKFIAPIVSSDGVVEQDDALAFHKISDEAYTEFLKAYHVKKKRNFDDTLDFCSDEVERSFAINGDKKSRQLLVSFIEEEDYTTIKRIATLEAFMNKLAVKKGGFEQSVIFGFVTLLMTVALWYMSGHDMLTLLLMLLTLHVGAVVLYFCLKVYYLARANDSEDALKKRRKNKRRR